MKTQLLSLTGWLYLVYLGLLPALATFATLVVYGSQATFVVFLGGLVGVSVYLAVIAGYTQLPESLWGRLFILIDGPLWVLLFAARRWSPFAYAVESYLVEGTALWLAILALAVRSPLPTREQRGMSVAFMVVAVAVGVFTYWPYVQAVLCGDWYRTGWLALGVVEGAATQYRLLDRDQVLRDGDDTLGYLLIMIMLWVAFTITGSALHDSRFHPVLFS
ncbi:MAG: hypothetical protein JXB35_16750 [Anaerolineae bacterium]|nr:hypothetical protein [Anaerolineae bacterium]